MLGFSPIASLVLRSLPLKFQISLSLFEVLATITTTLTNDVCLSKLLVEQNVPSESLMLLQHQLQYREQVNERTLL